MCQSVGYAAVHSIIDKGVLQAVYQYYVIVSDYRLHSTHVYKFRTQ